MKAIFVGVLIFFPHFAQKPICKGLRCWYEIYNQKYFNNELPQKFDVDYGPCPVPNVQACSWIETDKNGVEKAVIRLIAKYNIAPATAHENLLHEDCHLANPNAAEMHGEDWQNCMHRLANEGAFETLW